MKINYTEATDEGSIYAYPTDFGGEFGDCADGVDPFVADYLVSRGLLKKSDVFYTADIANGFKSRSRAKGSDEFDKLTGQRVARDKLLVKYYKFQARALDAYKAALEQLLEQVDGEKEFAENKVKNAGKRLENY